MTGEGFYDLVVIGSSPSLLARATDQIRNGKRVLVVDESAEAGGAWQSRSSFAGNEQRFEFAAHLISPITAVHDIFEDAAIPTALRPIYYWDHRPRIDEDYAWASNYLGAVCPLVGSDSSSLLTWTQFYAVESHRANTDAPTMSAQVEANRNYESSFRYFEPGVAALIDRLCENIGAGGGALELGSRVSAIDVEGSVVTVRLADRDIQTHKVLAGRHFGGSVSVDGVAAVLDAKQNDYSSLLLQFRSASAQPYRYMNVVGHPSVTSIQDCKPHTGELPPGIQVFAHSGAFDRNVDTHQHADSIMTAAIDIGVYNSDTELLEASRQDMGMASLASETCAAVQDQSRGAIELLSVSNLAHEINGAPDLWKRALAQ